MYHDIVRVAAVNHLVDLSGIQQYRANGHPAVHLRPMGPPANKSPYNSMCDGGCGRCLDPQWTYCSLSCKLGLAGAADEAADAIMYRKNGTITYDRSIMSYGGTPRSYITTTTTTTTNTGTFTKGGKRSSTKYGSTKSLAGTTASTSEVEEDLGYFYSNNNNNNMEKWSSDSYKRSAMSMMMVPRTAVKGAKRRKPFNPVCSHSL
jgi:hypothetical protein